MPGQAQPVVPGALDRPAVAAARRGIAGPGQDRGVAAGLRGLADCIIAPNPAERSGEASPGGPEHRPGYRPGDFAGATSIPGRDAETLRLSPGRNNDHSAPGNACQARQARRGDGRARRDHPGARATAGVIKLDIARDLLDPDSFIATGVYQDGAALERQESAPEVHRAMAMFAGSLAAPPDRRIYDASRDPTLA